MKPFVYVAGPLSLHPMHATHDALTFCSELYGSGLVVPFSPHATVVWDMIVPADYEQWMEYDLDVLPHMNAVYRMPGDSPGADREVAFAQSRGIPVFFHVSALLKWATLWIAAQSE